MAAHSKLRGPPITVSFIKRLVKDITTVYLDNRSRISKAVFLTLFVTLVHRIHSAISEQKAAQNVRTKVSLKSADKPKKVELNREFFKNILRLLKIVIPGWKSKEARLLVSHSIFLVARTLISLYVAELEGRIVGSLIRGKGREFLGDLIWWMTIAVPATFTNSMVCQNLLIFVLDLTVQAIISSMQTSSTISNKAHQLHHQQVSREQHFLRSISFG
jgi:ATP-binding cassette subfamily D (ALD) long-chain fatty acid import protein